MRPHAITNISSLRRSTRAQAVVLAVGLCSLAISASASGESGYTSVDAIMAASDTSSQSTGSLPTPDTYLAQSGSDIGGGSSVSSITAPPAGEPATAASTPSGSDDGFDWFSAAIGAAVALGLVALGSAGLVSARRRTMGSPSPASTS